MKEKFVYSVIVSHQTSSSTRELVFSANLINFLIKKDTANATRVQDFESIESDSVLSDVEMTIAVI